MDWRAVLVGGTLLLWLLRRLWLRRRRALRARWARERGIRCAVVGGGLSGIAAAIKLRGSGLRVTLFEKASGLGGTWLHNSYPGCRCDTPSHLYSYSFAPNAWWSYKWSFQQEILRYIQRVAADYGLTDCARLGCSVTRVRWVEDCAKWEVLTGGGGPGELFDFVVSATGQLNQPKIPDYKDAASFGGPSCHTGQWDHAIDLRGKRVACIGTGASAIQAWPEVAKVAGHCYVFQRQAPFIQPCGNYKIPTFVRAAFAYVPLLRRIQRVCTYIAWEGTLWIGWLAKDSRLTKIISQDYEKILAKEATHKEGLRVQMTPKYPPGCLRILLTDDWWPMLRRDNVDLVSDAIEAFNRKGIVTKSGKQYDVDVVLYGTGFHSQAFGGGVGGIRIEGRGGVALHERWGDTPSAHMGIAVPGFPNFFMMYGPNTNLNHNSIILMMEAQCEYICNIIGQLADRQKGIVEVPEAELAAFAAEVEQRMSKTVWTDPACGGSWYKNAAGVVTNNWFGSTVEYIRRCAAVDISGWHLSGPPRRAASLR